MILDFAWFYTLTKIPFMKNKNQKKSWYEYKVHKPSDLGLRFCFCFCFYFGFSRFCSRLAKLDFREAPVCHPWQADHMPWPLPLSICSYLWAPRTHNASRPPNGKVLEFWKRLGANFKNKDCVCVFPSRTVKSLVWEFIYYIYIYILTVHSICCICQPYVSPPCSSKLMISSHTEQKIDMFRCFFLVILHLKKKKTLKKTTKLS